MDKTAKVFDIIKELIIQEFGVEPKLITGDCGFHDDFSVDSLDILELFSQVESKFSINISDEATQELREVSSLVDYVVNKLPDSYFEE